jgi:hypothetical protein
MHRLVLLSVLLLAGCLSRPVEDESVAVPEFGHANSRSLTVVGTDDDGLNVPRDLEFNPHSLDQLWVVNRGDDSISIFFDAGSEGQWVDWRQDVYANHFMEEVSTLSFGAAGTYTVGQTGFATCQESRNTLDGAQAGNNFMGPTLWSADLDIFAELHQSYGDSFQGSHLDMLHGSPDCMGIVHDTGNAYWAFDGRKGQLVYYDFQEDHSAGMDDHSDGIIRRHTDVDLVRVEDVPGHLERNEDGILFIANTGAGTILKVDPSTAESIGDARGSLEPLEEYTRWNGATVEEWITGLEEPSGIALAADGRLFVSDHGTGEIIAFAADGTEIERLDTRGDSIMGIEIGPDGGLWYVDAGLEQLVRVDPGSNER